jgi:hypothetical protein
MSLEQTLFWLEFPFDQDPLLKKEVKSNLNPKIKEKEESTYVSSNVQIQFY